MTGKSPKKGDSNEDKSAGLDSCKGLIKPKLRHSSSVNVEKGFLSNNLRDMEEEK